MGRKGEKLPNEQIEFVRRNYSDCPNSELIAKTGMSLSSLMRIKGRYHLYKSDEQLRRAGAAGGRASAAARDGLQASCYSPEAIAKRSASYRQTMKMERARVLFGLEQKTKIKIRREPSRKTDQRSYLKRRGYIIDEHELIAYYTPDTRRATRLEKGIYGRSYYAFKPYVTQN